MDALRSIGGGKAGDVDLRRLDDQSLEPARCYVEMQRVEIEGRRAGQRLDRLQRPQVVHRHVAISEGAAERGDLRGREIALGHRHRERAGGPVDRSEEHTSELQSLMPISY